MNILITGGTGFIASGIIATLTHRGHNLTCCVRNPSQSKERLSNTTVIECDFNKDTTPEIWLKRLQKYNIEVVINCVGILQGSNDQSIVNIHKETPIALFNACKKGNIKRIIQISALGAGEVDTAYAKTKNDADQYLLSLKNLSRLVIRPSVVHSTGSYGGTSLFRGLSSLPLLIPVVGSGGQFMSPILLTDLSCAIAHYIEHPERSGQIIYAVGTEEISQKNMFITIRKWLGYPKAKCVSIPQWIISITAKIGNFFAKSPINSTSVTMLQHGNTHDPKPFLESVPFKILGFTEALQSMPSSTQDRWHARLYFIRPLLRFALAFLWLTSGLIPLFYISQSNELLTEVGIPSNLHDILRVSVSVFDILIGIAVVIRWRIGLLGMVQFFVVLSYTTFTIFVLSNEWLHPMGPLIKNIPILVLILIWTVIEDDR